MAASEHGGAPVIVLNLHGIGEPPHDVSSGEREVWLSCRQLGEFLDAFGARFDVHWTFDDGNISDVVHALPALCERGLTASFFICAGRLGAKGFVDARAVRELRNAGMTIGSHGMNHVRWRGLSAEELTCETADAKRILEDVIQQPIRQAACPFGDYDRQSLHALKQSGFEAVYTSDGGVTSESDWLRARYTLKRFDTPEAVMGMFNRHRGATALVGRAKQWMKRIR